MKFIEHFKDTERGSILDYLSRSSSNRKKHFKTCFLCGKKKGETFNHNVSTNWQSKFIKSNDRPQECFIENTAYSITAPLIKEQKIKDTTLYIHSLIPLIINERNSIHNVSTFRMLCSDCDKLYFTLLDRLPFGEKPIDTEIVSLLNFRASLYRIYREVVSSADIHQWYVDLHWKFVAPTFKDVIDKKCRNFYVETLDGIIPVSCSDICSIVYDLDNKRSNDNIAPIVFVHIFPYLNTTKIVFSWDGPTPFFIESIKNNIGNDKYSFFRLIQRLSYPVFSKNFFSSLPNKENIIENIQLTRHWFLKQRDLDIFPSLYNTDIEYTVKRID